MRLTEEQYNIINSSGNIKINAVAGSGKTTTIIEYSKSRPSRSRILYLAFNKSVKTEAEEKFSKLGLDNVKVETAHSLAYKNVIYKYDYSLKSNGYKTHEVAEILKIRRRKEKHFELFAANHINRFVSYFCNSSARKVNQLNYLDVISDPVAYDFVSKNYEFIEKQTRLFLSKMDSGEIEITHDFYLKIFQLQHPVLNYDYILFDEGQDASPAMLDVFLNQNAIKVIVGDSHQQIYSWRYAINSLEQVDYTALPLTTSFRFPQDIANLACEILKWKNMLSENIILPIKGSGGKNSNQMKATIARTNIGLLGKAFEFVEQSHKTQPLYFEGNIRERQKNFAMQSLLELKKLGESVGVNVNVLVEFGADVENVILSKAIEHKTDLVIVGTDVRPAGESLYIGPRVERLLNNCSCPVAVFNAQ